MRIYDRQAADTRQRFIDSAFELFTWQGYRTTSMNEIAKHSGGSRANLYLHFRNKPDIVLARMRELEPSFAAPFEQLFNHPPADHAAARDWLNTMSTLWMDERVEFSTIEQAMGQDEEVATEWWAMVQRFANSIPVLSNDPDRRMHFITLWMGLDRTFQFIYGRGFNNNEEQVLNSLAHQWLSLFH
ncbi:MAG: TetR/AcrR family transcriptional regulator [Corynebacterium sp.]|nr:TetR/AcrR family transcriptional regulator [Corynebacterium sp.]